MSVAERAADLAVARVLSGDDAGTSAPIEDDGLTVGRDPACGLVLTDRSVAPRHIHLKPLPSGAVLLNDLDMERGTWVEDEQVTCAVLTGGGASTEERIASIVEEATPSTVLVQAQRGDERTGNGTGWVLDADAGLLVTNAHVLNAGDRYTVGVGSSLRRA